MQPKSNPNVTWRAGGKESLEIYSTVPATIWIYHCVGFNGPITTFNVTGYFTGLLISVEDITS